MTGILFGPISVRIALNSVCSSTASGAAAAAGRRRGGCGGRGRGGDAVAVLEALDELGQLEHGHLVDGLEQIVLGENGHGMDSFVGAGPRTRGWFGGW